MDITSLTPSFTKPQNLLKKTKTVIENTIYCRKVPPPGGEDMTQPSSHLIATNTKRYFQRGLNFPVLPEEKFHDPVNMRVLAQMEALAQEEIEKEFEEEEKEQKEDKEESKEERGENQEGKEIDEEEGQHKDEESTDKHINGDDNEESRKGLKKPKEKLPILQVPPKRLHGAIKAQATKAQKALYTTNTKTTQSTQSNTTQTAQERQNSSQTAKQQTTGKKRKLEEDKPHKSKRQK